MLCLPCLGTGEYPGGRTCPRCAGRGELPDDRLHNPMCPYCIGKGRDPFARGKLCSACDGWGRLPGKEQPEQAVATLQGTPAGDMPSRRSSSGGGGVDAAPGVPKGAAAAGPHSRAPAADRLDDLLGDMVGDVEVCVPSLDAGSLDRLRLLRRCDLIRVLAHDVEVGLVPRIRQFTRDLPRFLFRRYRGREIQDRFVLTPSEIIFLEPRPQEGNGRESMLIRVPSSVASEMIEDVRAGFDRKWRAAERLS